MCHIPELSLYGMLILIAIMPLHESRVTLHVRMRDHYCHHPLLLLVQWFVDMTSTKITGPVHAGRGYNASVSLAMYMISVCCYCYAV